jgi:hypothetical protein
LEWRPALPVSPTCGIAGQTGHEEEKKIMEIINDGGSNEQQNLEAGVLAGGTKWKIAPVSTVTKAVLAEYLAIVAKAAKAAINERASDWAEEAVRVLAVGFGAAMIEHGRQLNDEGYEQGDFDCKGSLGLWGTDGKETADYHRLRAEAHVKRKAEWEAERLTSE